MRRLEDYCLVKGSASCGDNDDYNDDDDGNDDDYNDDNDD
jgi:hypothetical protein